MLKLGKNFPITAPREESPREKEADIAIKQFEQGQRWAGRNEASLVIAFNLTPVLKIHTECVFPITSKKKKMFQGKFSG